jgi:hypothetical protein
VKTPDFQRFNELMTGMARMYGSAIDRIVLDAYWLALRDWELDDFEAACGHLMRTSKFMPRPAEFTELRKAGDATPGEVFGTLRQWLHYTPNGYQLKPSTPRRIASAFAAIGGAQGYAMCDSDKLHFLEKRFCEHYEQISEHEDVRQALPGILDARLKRLMEAAK